MSQIKLVVSDLAGTTLKDEGNVASAFQNAMKINGYEIPIHIINPLMGFKKTEAILMMLGEHEPDSSKITNQIIDKIHQDFIEIMISFYESSISITALPDVEETMRQIKANGVKIGINTGFSKEVAEVIVKRLQWREKGLIDLLVGSDEVEKGRPYPYMIQKMMKELGIENRAEIAKIGDTEVDILEGHQAGCAYIIGVTTGAYTRQELEKANPTHIIDSFRELNAILFSDEV
ncbi:MAG: HAD-IA family hydrolase [Sphingobacteriales bacterium]|nr:HAD-IA family hydrolase [Sphingobacteriales bacterium]